MRQWRLQLAIALVIALGVAATWAGKHFPGWTDSAIASATVVTALLTAVTAFQASSAASESRAAAEDARFVLRRLDPPYVGLELLQVSGHLQVRVRARPAISEVWLRWNRADGTERVTSRYRPNVRDEVWIDAPEVATSMGNAGQMIWDISDLEVRLLGNRDRVWRGFIESENLVFNGFYDTAPGAFLPLLLELEE